MTVKRGEVALLLIAEAEITDDNSVYSLQQERRYNVYKTQINTITL